MKQRVQEALREVDEDPDGVEQREWYEYHTRKRMGKCTCDLLDPFGHVTCPECNEDL